MRRDVRILVAIIKILVGDDPCCDCWGAARLHVWQIELGGGFVSNSNGLGNGHGVAVLDL